MNFENFKPQASLAIGNGGAITIAVGHEPSSTDIITVWWQLVSSDKVLDQGSSPLEYEDDSLCFDIEDARYELNEFIRLH